MCKRKPALILAVLSTTISLQAAVVVVRSDAGMTRAARAIVTGTAVEVFPRLDERGDVRTVVRVLIDETIKGPAPAGDILELVQFGGHIGDRYQAQSGAPRYEIGARYLLFLDQNRAGRWTTLDLAMGQFRFVDRDGTQLLVRDTHEITAWTKSSEAFRDAARPAQPFLAHIRDLAAQSQAAVVEPLDTIPDLDFDLKAVAQEAVGRWAGAEAVMNDVVSPTPASDDKRNLFDCESRIIANDPHNDVAGTFNGDGVIATSMMGCGPPCGSCATSTKNGENYVTIDEADVVLNDGISASTISGQDFLSVIVHELGHTWGFRHSNQRTTDLGPCAPPLPCESHAIMNSMLLRGVNGALQDWDLDAANEVYGDGSREAAHTGTRYVLVVNRPMRRPSAKAWRIAQFPCTPPTVSTAQASPTTIQPGQPSRLSATATGSLSLAYAWFTGTAPDTSRPAGGGLYNDVYPNATTSYWVRVSNRCGSQGSAPVTVTVNQPPCAPPSNVVVTATPPSSAAGEPVTLSVASFDGTTPANAFEWFAGMPPGGVSTGYFVGTITVRPEETTTYYARVGNACGAANSNPVTIGVSGCVPPSITTQPASRTIIVGSSVTLSVVAAGTEPLAYRWFEGATGDTSKPQNGATSASFTTPALVKKTQYWVRIDGSCTGAQPVFSNTATVEVKGGRGGRPVKH